MPPWTRLVLRLHVLQFHKGYGLHNISSKLSGCTLKLYESSGHIGFCNPDPRGVKRDCPGFSIGFIWKQLYWICAPAVGVSAIRPMSLTNRYADGVRPLTLIEIHRDVYPAVWRLHF